MAAQMTYLLGNNINQARRNQYLITFNNSFDSTSTRTTLLKILKPAQMDASDRAECLPGTYTRLLTSLFKWTNDTSNQSVYWINSPARVGKTAVATTIANQLATAGRLGAFLFFDRGAIHDPGFVIRTMAFQMGCNDPCLGKIIAAAIENTPDGFFPTFREQFQQFIINPLLTRQSTAPEGSSSGRNQGDMPMVVVLDGLDNCGDPNSRKLLLKALVEATIESSSFFRIIVASCATTDIHNAFLHKEHIVSHQLDVTSNYAGILTCVQRRAEEMNIPLSDRNLQFIAKRACGWFPWVVVALPDMHNPTAHLEELLKGQLPSKLLDELEALYRSLLEAIGFWDDDEFIRDFRAILGVIITAKMPLSCVAIDHLLGSSLGQSSQHTISRLRSSLFDDTVVHLLHPSFGSFLSSRDRSGSDIWFIDPLARKCALVLHCLELMNGTLKKLISDITFTSRIGTTRIPEALAYACKHWIDHICDVGKDIWTLLAQLHIFLNQHLHYWLLAMKLLKRSGDAFAKLKKFSKWIATNFPTQNRIFELIRNAWYMLLESISGYTTPKLPTPTRLHELIHDAYHSSQTFTDQGAPVL